MLIKKTILQDAYLITPDVFGDNRGYFFESYSKTKMKEIFDGEFIQDNQSLSTKKGVIRGLHCQAGKFSQTKLVRVVEGAVDDVIVDVRTGSPSYLKWIRVRLSGENQNQLFIPKGFLHADDLAADLLRVLDRLDHVLKAPELLSVEDKGPFFHDLQTLNIIFAVYTSK